MSAQRAMPSTTASGATFRLIAALILGIVLGAAGAFLLTDVAHTEATAVLERIAPAEILVAEGTEAPTLRGKMPPARSW